MKKKRLFKLGETLIVSVGAMDVVFKSNQRLARFLFRHVTGDFGDINKEEAAANAMSIKTNGEIISRYTTANGSEILVMTEAGVTQVVTPREYLGETGER
jgi:hypothetical protein